MHGPRFIIFVLFLLASFPLYAAEEFQDLTLLHQRAHDFLQEKVKVGSNERVVLSVSQLDPRLRLPKCEADKIQVFLPNESDLATTKNIGVSCQGAQAWTVYMTSKVAIFVKVAVATQNIPKDALLDSTNVELVEKDRVSLATGYFTSMAPLEKMTAKRMLMAGHVITPELIRAETVIRRGDAVTINVNSGNLKVEMGGVAMGNGGAGERIYVRNSSSNRTVEARVIAPGKVEAVM